MKMPMKVKGAIFDMDGTLIDSLFFWDRFWQSIAQRDSKNEGRLPDEALAKRVRTTTYPDALRLVAEAYGITDSSFFEEYLQFLKDFYRYEVTPKPGAEEILLWLREQGIAICLASASHKDNLEIALRAVGLREYIDSLHSCEEVGVGKERPDVFLKAADLMGISPAECCVFEDSFLALETAKAAGFHTVGVYDRYSYEQERLRTASEIYLAKGQTLADLIGQIKFDDERL
ncbi:MAG: HAD family phosphatase [Clostridia bacterium]|nr:HAD family phosphatase [Clostridia bacterium]